MNRLKRPASSQLRGGDLAKLVNFVNSLVLIDDGSSLTVKQTPLGTSVSLSEEEQAKINNASIPQDISATVVGGTAFIAISKSTSKVKLVGTGDASLSINENGEIEINAEGGETQDLSASVSGNTASIAISGSTSHVDLVGTGDVTLSLNENGQIEINCTVGGGGQQDFTVNRSSGREDGSIFHAISVNCDSNVTFDNSLDGTPIDFEGASVL